MTRTLAVVALLALPAVASAQDVTLLPPGTVLHSGQPVINTPITNGPSALFQIPTPVLPRWSVGGGSLGEPTQTWRASGAWSNVYYPWPVVLDYDLEDTGPAQVPGPVRIRVRDTTVRGATLNPQAALADRATATLVVQFPAAAEVTVGGKKLEGDPKAEWTLTSPTLKTGESHKFEVKGRWKADGKTYEATRTVSVNAGERNRSIVVSGTEVKE